MYVVLWLIGVFTLHKFSRFHEQAKLDTAHAHVSTLKSNIIELQKEVELATGDA